MLLRLPPTLHYPITVTSLLKRPGDKVERNEALFWYVYETTVTEGDGLGNKIEVRRQYPTKFESTVDGEVIEWKITKGDVIEEPVTVVEIEEPCAHEIQFGGMCAECGQDMTTATYNTDVMDSMRAPIQMVHDNTALTVSEREATRVEEDAKRRLLASRRLSLVVDLDQTIIHATVDPTVGEWKEDKDNPNHEAVKDVRCFQLTDDGPGMRGCWYYIKLRPGLEEFLQNISKLYELHIYTMGTRAYAQNIANIIDPDRKLFGDRILSRDESGSLTAKNLQRLFPVDTKMVVIIDDRGDVWRWNPNLIKVSPYDFFVGIGDINSSFLPKKPELTPGTGSIKGKREKEQQQTQATAAERRVNGSIASNNDTETEVSALEQLVTMGGGDNPRLLQEQAVQQEETILQQELDAEEEAAESQGGADSETSSSMDESQEVGRHRHHLLEDHDTELYALQERLERVHQKFFEEYDRRRSQALGGRVAALKGDKALPKDKDIDLKLVPDIKTIMPQIKREVLDGVNLVFSGVLPLGTDTQNADISLWAKSFGAVISTKIGSKTTHLVAGRNRTAKVREATRYPKIKIVTTQWLLDSLTQWKHLDEEPYLVPVHPEDRGDPILGSSPGSKNAAEAESSWLSSSEEDTGVSFTDDEGEDAASEDKIDTDELEEADEEILKSSGMTAHSPIGYDAEQQKAVHDELREFLGSDAESDSEFDDNGEGDSDVFLGSESSASKKRKREGEDGDEQREEDEALGSRLSQRIKLSRERTSGLKEVATAEEGPVEGEGDEDEGIPDTSGDRERDGGDGYPEDPDDDDDALEREMLAAFEDGNYNSAAEEEVAEENG
ncbi:Phosphoprotein phosphatase [Rasamsonia emersonii CBS 393.64]|uniref:RNA polymerase II subunit A C-terminal domain phosphatase n=1 Tax=Rasamsonia emersonii (strain ATCC 16479 / CBS 393.64 / IMI 116815) TaxID=1408163 RepID=A0A0F4YTZ5_RASE3|nr:Phosphoprotein phosphatase [Rasamsonia emersonii CBS 393.64]KKA21311.1 Phosphoprotein phosphatase [Rasamsonia emersonii CBS 393.64]